MSSPGDEEVKSQAVTWDDVLSACYSAMLNFGQVEFQSLTRKVIYRLQRIPASGIYGEDYHHKTLWDEYCFEMLKGPSVLLQDPWDVTIDHVMSDVLERVPSHSARLLTIYAASELEEDEEIWISSTVWPDGILRVLRMFVDRHAIDRAEGWWDENIDCT